VNHHASSRFWDCYDRLPAEVRKAADAKFVILKSNPNHPSLHLKQIGKFWSVRVTKGIRCLALPVEDGFLWFWIGDHEAYEKLLSSAKGR